MIEYGRSVRWFNDYSDEIAFSTTHQFNFMQIWFLNGELVLDKVPSPKEQYVLNSNFPAIIHALYDINDFEKYNHELVRILKLLDHNEVIIHPICKTTAVNPERIHILADHVYKTNELLKENGIKLYIENNSVIDNLNYTPSDLKSLFDRNPDVELLLDLAHIDSYDHLQKIIDVKFPKCIHIADKHFNVAHEHLPIGQGELDFELIFQKYLKGYAGKIIFEVADHDDAIITSKNLIQKILEMR